MADELETQDARETGPSMEDTIRAKLDEINQRESDEDLFDAEPDPDTEGTDEALEAIPESPSEKAARLTDAGKTRRNNDARSRKSRLAKTGNAEQGGDQSVEQPAALRAPNSWSPKGKADFKALPQHIQAEVLKREDDFHRGLETYKSDAQFAQTIRKIAQPYEATIRAEGGQVEGAFSDYLNSAYLLRHGAPAQKAHFVRQLIQQFNVPLPLADANGAQASAWPGEQMPDLQANPHVNPVVAQLLDKVGRLEQHFTGQAQSAHRAQELQTRNDIHKFSADQSKTFFEDVRHDMADLLSGDRPRAKTLDEAYDMACWSRPDIRALLFQQQEKARRQVAQTKAQQAKRAAGHNVSRRGAFPAQAPKGSIEDTIRSEMQRLGIQ